MSIQILSQRVSTTSDAVDGLASAVPVVRDGSGQIEARPGLWRGVKRGKNGSSALILRICQFYGRFASPGRVA